MMTLGEIRNNRQLLNDIDWNMTPEEAVRLYLEWGNNWARGNYVIRSKEDVSHYFVVNTWKGKPVLYLVRRNSEMAQDLASIEVPHPIAERFMQTVGYNKGVYAVDGELRQWLQQELGLQSATS